MIKIGVVGDIVPGAFARLQDQCKALSLKEVCFIQPNQQRKRPISDRERYLMGTKPEVYAKLLAQECQEVRQQGAEYLVMLSIPAHLRMNKVDDQIKKTLKILHVIDLLCDQISQSAQPVAYLAHETIIDARIFETALKERQKAFLQVEAPPRVSVAQGIQWFLEYNNPQEAYKNFLNAIEFYVKKRGAKIVCLGSFSIPLTLHSSKIKDITDSGVVLLDPYQVIVQAIQNICLRKTIPKTLTL